MHSATALVRSSALTDGARSLKSRTTDMIDYPVVAGKKLVFWFGGAGLVVLLVTVLVFRFYGWSRFVANSRLMEGKNNTIYLARSVMSCAEKENALPESSPKVPADAALVAGKTYASTAADWSPHPYACGDFSMKDPQAFQYEWEKKDDLDGTTRAKADFNGDGFIEATFEQEIICTKTDQKLRCRPGAFKDLAQ